MAYLYNIDWEQIGCPLHHIPCQINWTWAQKFSPGQIKTEQNVAYTSYEDKTWFQFHIYYK
jgi:hypothetical protein